MRRMVIVFILALIAYPPPVYAGTDELTADNRDLFLRSAFYRGNQHDWFAAIAQIDYELVQHFELDDPSLDSLYRHIDDAQFAFGDFELSYGLNKQASHALTRLIDHATNSAQRDDALYRLAKLQFIKGQFREAEGSLSRMTSEESGLSGRAAMLQGQIAMSLGNYDDAVNYFDSLDQSNPEFLGFASYNRGIALLGAGHFDAGIRQLILTSQLSSGDPLLMVVRDKANQVLGEYALANGDYAMAKDHFSQVRLESPYANRALLGAGWASVKLQDFSAALVPWTRLSEQQQTDQSVHEALLALPYAYAKLGIYSTAANKYRHALDVYSMQVESLQASIANINNGKLLELLDRPEIIQDKNWLVRLRDWPDAPETYYLVDLMAEHSFNSALQNYIDLSSLRRKLETWRLDVEAFKELVALRKEYYEPVLDFADQQLSALVSRLNLHLEQSQAIDDSLRKLLVVPDHRLLATAAERIATEQLSAIRKLSDSGHLDLPAKDFARVGRLEGALSYTQKIEFPERLSQAYVHLQDLRALLIKVQQQYGAYLRFRQSATLSYLHFSDRLEELDSNISEQLKRTNQVMLLQGLQLEKMTTAVLEQRLERLRQFQTRARFAMADSYDRAAREQTQE